MNNFCPDLIALSETKLNENNNYANCHIPGFNFEQANSPTNAGGVGAYINSDITYQVRHDLKFDLEGCENLWLELEFNTSTNCSTYIIGIIYKHPHCSTNKFSDFFSKSLFNLNSANKKYFLIGDFNINLLNPHNTFTQHYRNTFESLGCFSLVDKPTRVTNHSSTLLDHLYTNKIDGEIDIGILEIDMSDHFPVVAKIKNISPVKVKHEHIKVRKSSNIDYEQFVIDLEFHLNQISMNTDESMQLELTLKEVIAAINNVINKHMPLVTLSRKKSRLYKKPWISKGIQVSMRHRDALYKKYLNHKNENNFVIYKTYRNKLTHLKELSRQNYFRNLLKNSDGKSSKVWAVINQMLNKKKRNTGSSPGVPPIKVHGHAITNPIDISNAFVEHFTNIGSNMSSKIPNTYTHFNETLEKSLPNSIALYDTTKEEILNEIRNLNNNKCTGPDNIPVKILKLGGVLLSPILSNLLNKCMKTGIFPDILKTASITPIYKKGEKSFLSNYRPISVLTHLSKIFERIIYKRLTNFFERFNILDKCQYGFRQNCSTSLAISDLYEQLLSSMDKGFITCCIYLDLAKAFDTVNHNILISKLMHYGIRGNALNLVKSYLTNRMQYVEISGIKSKSLTVRCGVPQGSVLGPLLFLVYVNDLPNASKLNTRMFADDTVLFYSHKSSKHLEDTINLELQKISNWFCSNKLSLNVDKTKCMILSKAKNSPILSIKIDGREIERSHSYKYLGVIIDDKLKWHNHIMYISKKISKLSGIFYKIRSVASTKVLILMYYALVYPHLQYSITSWGSASKTALAPLQVIQNRILKCITYAKFKQAVSPIYKKTKILKLSDLHILELAKFMFKVKKHELPKQFNSYFVNVASIHSYNTRLNQNDNKFLRRVKTTSGQKKLEFNGVKTWNNLPNFIKNTHTLPLFSHKLKKYLMELY